MKAKDLKPNDSNPRTISKDKLEQLKGSLQRSSKFMELRPIIIDEQNIIIAGNQRFRALQELGYDEIPDKWIDKAEGYTEEEIREFIVIDNLPFGQWLYDQLLQDYTIDEKDSKSVITIYGKMTNKHGYMVGKMNSGIIPFESERLIKRVDHLRDELFLYIFEGKCAQGTLPGMTRSELKENTQEEEGEKKEED